MIPISALLTAFVLSCLSRKCLCPAVSTPLSSALTCRLSSHNVIQLMAAIFCGDLAEEFQAYNAGGIEDLLGIFMLDGDLCNWLEFGL